MKSIKGKTILSVSASSENAKFPVTNLLDDHPKRLFKTDDASQVKLTFSVSSGTAGIAIFNTNAMRAVCNISDPNQITWCNVDWQNVKWATTKVATTTYVISSEYSMTIWIEFEASSVGVDADVTLTNESEPVYAGKAAGGVLFDLESEPSEDSFQAGDIDYSIEYEMSNGSYYTIDRDTVDTFSGQIRVSIPVYHEFKALYKQTKKKPLPWMVLDQGAEWAVFAKFAAPPLYSIKSHYVIINFNLKEVL